MTEPLSGSPPPAVTKAYDILLWLVNHVGKFPRSHRFVLGDRLITLKTPAPLFCSCSEAKALDLDRDAFESEHGETPSGECGRFHRHGIIGEAPCAHSSRNVGCQYFL